MAMGRGEKVTRPNLLLKYFPCLLVEHEQGWGVRVGQLGI